MTLVTKDTLGLRGRPLTVGEEYDGTLRFLVSKETLWARSLSKGETALMVVADPADNLFCVLWGSVRTKDHRGTIERLWSPAAKAFFDGVDDPTLAVLEFKTVGGQWWDGPATKLGTAISLVRSAITRDEDEAAGDAGIVTPR